MSKFPPLSTKTLAVRGPRSTDFDDDGDFDEDSDRYDGESDHSDAPATSNTRKNATQADVRATNPHYLCPGCPLGDGQHACQVASHISIHWKRKHLGSHGPWNKQHLADILVVHDGVTFRYGDRLNHPNMANCFQNSRRENPDFTDEAILGRATAIHRLTKPSSVLDKFNIIEKAREMKREYLEKRMSAAEQERRIGFLQEQLDQSRAQADVRANVYKGAIEGRDSSTIEPKSPAKEASKARIAGSKLAQKVRSLLTNLRPSGRGRSRSPDRPYSVINDYRSRSPIPGGIFRRSTYDSQAPLIPYYGPAELPDRGPSRVRIKNKSGREKKPDESESSEEVSETSEVSEEE